MTQEKKKMNVDKIVLAIVLVAIATVLALLVPAYTTAMETGKNLGKTIGTATGTLVGSYNGVMNGLEDGKQAAKTPNVNVTETQTKVRALGNLEVLVIEMDYLDVFKSDQTENPEYAEIYSEKVKLIYTVDLTSAIVETRDNQTVILIPNVQYADPSLDESTYHRFDYYTKSGKAGSTIDGIKQESDSKNALMLAIKERAGNAYLNKARDAAISQVTSLAKAMTGKEIKVEFKGD